MSERNEFLRAIEDDPEDDVLRLVFADWIEEHGEPERAEFVRVQCELAQLDEGDARYHDLKPREQALFTRHGKTWLRPLRPFWKDVQFGRGFPCYARTTANALFQHGEVAFDLEPIGAVHFRYNRGILASLAGSSALGRIRCLDVRGSFAKPADALRRLIDAPQACPLHTLDITGVPVGQRTVRWLVRSERLAGLRVLRGGAALAGFQSPTPLAYPNSPLMRGLHTLDLSNAWLMGERGVELAGSPNLAGLRRLSLRHASMHEVVLEMARTPHLAGLEWLDLGEQNCWAAQAAEFFRVASFPRLHTLDLADFWMPWTADPEPLAEARGFPALRRLRLARSWMFLDDALAPSYPARLGRFARSDLCRRLTHLDFSDNDLKGGAGEALFSSPSLANLRFLDLGSCKFDDAALDALTHSPHLGELRLLDLSWARLTAEQLLRLTRSPSLGRLRSLNLNGHQLEPAVQGALADRFGEQTLTFHMRRRRPWLA